MATPQQLQNLNLQLKRAQLRCGSPQQLIKSNSSRPAWCQPEKYAYGYNKLIDSNIFLKNVNMWWESLNVGERDAQSEQKGRKELEKCATNGTR